MHTKMAVYCEKLDEERTKSVIKSSVQKLGYTHLKPEQLNIIMGFLRGRDVFTILPTGFGKMLCFACLPLAFDELTHRIKPSIVLVVTPLNVITKDYRFATF